MRNIRVHWCSFVVVLLSGFSALAEEAVVPGHRAFLDKYCVSCHGEEKQKGDRRFDSLGAGLDSLDSLTAWQEILDQLNLGEMPPSKAEHQPTEEEVKKMVAGITAGLDQALAAMEGDLAEPVVRPSEQAAVRQHGAHAAEAGTDAGRPDGVFSAGYHGRTH